jgi:hypothetical protein
MKRLIRKAKSVDWKDFSGGGYFCVLDNGKRYDIDPVPKKKGKFDVYAPNGTTLNYAPLSLEEAKQVVLDYIYKENPEYMFDGQMAEYVQAAEIALKNGMNTDAIKDLKVKAFAQGYLDMASGSGYDETQLADKSLESHYEDGYNAYRKVKGMD